LVIDDCLAMNFYAFGLKVIMFAIEEGEWEGVLFVSSSEDTGSW
jgi:hypothetical protein